MALMLITHDLGIVESLCDRITVLYAGRCMEQGPTPEVLAQPRHPYTRALLRARPRLNGGPRPEPIRGTPPRGSPPHSACAFAPRCDEVSKQCWIERPAWHGGPNGGCACIRTSVHYTGTHT